MSDEYEMSAEVKDASDVFLILDKPSVGYGFPLSHDEDGELDSDYPMMYALNLRVCTIDELGEAKEAGVKGPDDMDLHEMVFIMGEDELKILVETSKHVLKGGLGNLP